MKNIVLLIIAITLTNTLFAKTYKLLSPDKKTELIISFNPGISITAFHQSVQLFRVDTISMEIEGENFAVATDKKKGAKKFCR